MKTFIGQKLGEVLAFEEVALEALEKGRSTFEQALDPDLATKVSLTKNEFIDRIRTYAKSLSILNNVEQAGYKTAEKLRKMRDTYLDSEEDWKDVSEISEWGGFFEGGATAHWSVIEGIAEQKDDAFLKQFASEALEFHKDLFDIFSENLRNIAMEETERKL